MSEYLKPRFLFDTPIYTWSNILAYIKYFPAFITHKMVVVMCLVIKVSSRFQAVNFFYNPIFGELIKISIYRGTSD